MLHNCPKKAPSLDNNQKTSEKEMKKTLEEF